MFEQCLALNPTPNPVFELITGNNAIAPFKLQTTARTKLGRIHFIGGDSAKAISLYMEELKQQPDQPDAYSGLGWAYLEQNRALEARAAFTMAIRLEPLNNSSQKGIKAGKTSHCRRKVRSKNGRPSLKNASKLAHIQLICEKSKLSIDTSYFFRLK